MAPTPSLDSLDHEALQNWLPRALRGQEPLPRLTPDESLHIAIERLEKTLKPATRASVRDASLHWVREFCARGDNDSTYVEELLALASTFKIHDATPLLSELASADNRLTQLEPDVRLAVLAALVDLSPPQLPEFWEDILQRSPKDYAALALSGLLAINPDRAVRLLPSMPDTELSGRSAVLKLDLAWDDLPPKDRFRFVDEIQKVLPLSGDRFAAPVRAWLDVKRSAGSESAGLRKAIAAEDLRAALAKKLGPEADPRELSPKLRTSSNRNAA
jgi:hypothetical protein